MVKDVGLEKSALYSDCVNYYGTSMSMNIGGITVRNQELYNGHQEYEIQLIIREWVDDEKIQVDIDYKIADYTEKDIECMFNCFCTITDTILSDPDIPIKQICLQSKREQKETVFKYNNTFYREEKDYETVIDMFLKQVQQNPDAIAIHDSDNILTYKQLDTASENLSQKLINIGVSKNVFVALYTSHSIETIIGILGILKAGGAYLPIDPKYPVDWINHIIKDSGVSIILYNLSLPYDLAFSGIKISLHDTCNDSQQTGNEIITDLCEIPAYAIYTSGSTGKPKGVVVCHEALRNYIHWAEKQYSNHDKPYHARYIHRYLLI